MHPHARRLLRLPSWLCIAPALALPMAAQSATIYLCKAYSGGTFWSSGHCSSQKAMIERMVSVPDGMPFEQQVQLGNQAAAEAAKLTTTPQSQSTQTVTRTTSSASSQLECKALDDHIKQLDAMARQPQTAAQQNSIAQRRRNARDRQFQLGCR